MAFYRSCHQKIWPRVVFSPQTIPSRKLIYRYDQLFRFSLCPNVIMLSTKIDHHNVTSTFQMSILNVPSFLSCSPQTGMFTWDSFVRFFSLVTEKYKRHLALIPEFILSSLLQSMNNSIQVWAYMHKKSNSNIFIFEKVGENLKTQNNSNICRKRGYKQHFKGREQEMSRI